MQSRKENQQSTPNASNTNRPKHQIAMGNDFLQKTILNCQSTAATSPVLTPDATVPNQSSLIPNSNSAVAEALATTNIPSAITPSMGTNPSIPMPATPNISTPEMGSSLAVPAIQELPESANLPNATTPSSGDIVNVIDNILQDYTTPTTQSPNHSDIGSQEVQQTDGSSFADQPEFISPDSPSTQTPSGHNKEMKVFHSFDNNVNQDLSLRHIGDIQSVIAESKTAKDGLFSTDYGAKHYTITFNRNYRSISVEPGDWTGGGREDSGITVARIEKQSPTVFKIWFNRAQGANTYVNEFMITGTPG